MRYDNPVILGDYSDPDVIRKGDNFYLVASSFNHTPGVPVLKSKNLVDWKIINYVFDEIPFPRFNDVCHGDGAWAPAIRYHNGLYYVIIPFPDEGVYVSATDDIEKGNWSKPWCLIEGKGIIDPCPIWHKDKCYMVVGFAKSRIGFNSVLGLYEVTPDLKTQLTDYKIIFDGHNTQPTIEGPKFNYRNGYFYIMAPAGSVKAGWQVCLRSKDVYGPYEEKIVMLQNDSKINGPHQGALIDLKNDEWAFMHFQDMGPYGRVVHLQPVKWVNDWPLCGNVRDELLGGTPFDSHDYIIDKKSSYSIPTSDNFKGRELSVMWQTPANKTSLWYDVNDGLTLYCAYHNDKAYKALNMTPNLFLTKIAFKSFTVRTKCILDLVNDGDEVGLCYMGSSYQYICLRRIDGKNHLQLRQGYFNQDNDVILFDSIYQNSEIEFMMKYTEPNIYQLGFDKTYFKNKFTATPGRWIGGKYGIYARGLKTGGKAVFKSFSVKKVK
ncbi:MAG: glycosyl hydrolase 43 family protein [Erysipelotrichaceae bacterium]|nr:glycosyl hydrolase 43 family protein [Erysipelotrichaceae bacterium]